MSIGKLPIVLFLLCASRLFAANIPDSIDRNVRDYATIETWCNGVPIYSFDNLTYIYGIAPDLLNGVEMQRGNQNKPAKIKLKRS